MKRRENSSITAKRKVFRIRLIALLLLVVWNSLLANRLRTVRQITTKKVLDKQILSELQYFPLAFQNEHRETTWKAGAVICNYEDSWQSARTFGGARKHEGTDLMTIRNERGIYPIVSMTDGTLEQMGWLKLGGWRIGIRSASGTYYYYAHLESYAPDLEDGMAVHAGQLLGFAGDSGYGTEGTTGQFAVHLHVGIYIHHNTDKEEAINPYPYLKQLEQHRIYADYP